jgi:transcriptional regulator with XRE-family HTH domain
VQTSTSSNKDIGQWLRLHREISGLSQEAYAGHAGLTRIRLVRIEAGTAIVTVKELRRLERMLSRRAPRA